MTLNWDAYGGLEFDSPHLHFLGGAQVFDGVGELRITLNNIVRFERATVAA